VQDLVGFFVRRDFVVGWGEAGGGAEEEEEDEGGCGSVSSLSERYSL